MAVYTMKQMNGVIAAMLTMFDEHENVDVLRTRKATEFLLERGIDGFYLTGSTGEGFMMDHDERKLVVETVVSQVAGRKPVIAHVGDISTKKSIQLAEHAYRAGADAISSVPPFYGKFSEDDIYGYYKDLSEATPLPLIIYNVPLAGLMGADLIERIAQMPNVQGLKFTGKDHDQMCRLISRLGEDFVVYSGCDEMALSGLLVGADGLIGSFYNVMPELYLRLHAAVKAGDMDTAKRCQKIATEIILECIKYDFLSVARVMLSWQGLDAGYCRRPFHNYREEELGDLKKKLLDIRNRYQVTDD